MVFPLCSRARASPAASTNPKLAVDATGRLARRLLRRTGRRLTSTTAGLACAAARVLPSLFSDHLPVVSDWGLAPTPLQSPPPPPPRRAVGALAADSTLAGDDVPPPPPPPLSQISMSSVLSMSPSSWSNRRAREHVVYHHTSIILRVPRCLSPSSRHACCANTDA